MQNFNWSIRSSDASKDGKIADFVRAKNNCAQTDRLESGLNRRSQAKQNEVLFNVNLVWATLKDKGLVKQNESLALSLS